MRLLLTCTLALGLVPPAAMAADGRTPMPTGMGWRANAEAAEVRSELAAADPMASINVAASPSAPLLALLDSQADLSLFTAALRQSGKWRDLDAKGPLIVLAPSNRAMQAEGSAFLLDSVMLSGANARRLEDLMTLHLVTGAGSLSEFIAQGEVTTASGACLSIDEIGGRVRIGPQASVLEHHAVAGSSVYVIDSLLWQPWTTERTCGGHR